MEQSFYFLFVSRAWVGIMRGINKAGQQGWTMAGKKNISRWGILAGVWLTAQSAWAAPGADPSHGLSGNGFVGNSLSSRAGSASRPLTFTLTSSYRSSVIGRATEVAWLSASGSASRVTTEGISAESVDSLIVPGIVTPGQDSETNPPTERKRRSSRPARAASAAQPTAGGSAAVVQSALVTPPQAFTPANSMASMTAITGMAATATMVGMGMGGESMSGMGSMSMSGMSGMSGMDVQAAPATVSTEPRRVMRLGVYARDADLAAVWNRLLQKHGTVLQGLTPGVALLQLQDGRMLPALVAEAATTAELPVACLSLRAQGGQCLVQTLRRGATVQPLTTEALAAAAEASNQERPRNDEAAAGEGRALTRLSDVPRGQKVIRLGFYVKERDAQSGWTTLLERHADVFSGLTPVVYRSQATGRGRYQVLAAVAPDSVDLNARCAQLQLRGEGCMVVTPNPVPTVVNVPTKPVQVAGAQVPPTPVPEPNDEPAPTMPAGLPPAPVPPAPPAAPSVATLPVSREDRIIISLADKRLYFASADGQQHSFPVAIARSPEYVVVGETRVVRKRVNPTWRPTPDMRRRDPKLPARVGPGPRNPLGSHAIDLGWQYISIHGTNEPQSVGSAASSGCYRMLKEDIRALFSMVPVGTRVQVVESSLQPPPSHGPTLVPAALQHPVSPDTNEPVGSY